MKGIQQANIYLQLNVKIRDKYADNFELVFKSRRQPLQTDKYKGKMKESLQSNYQKGKGTLSSF